MTKVLPRLYIGDMGNASDYKWLKAHGITHIINCADEIPNYFSGQFHYLRMKMLDAPNEYILNKLEPSCQYITRVFTNSPKNVVLIHCAMGISRSASVCIYFLMRKNGWSYKQAKAYLKKLHPRTHPNIGYEAQLMSV
jgi:protein-tyrosine phosphatase